MWKIATLIGVMLAVTASAQLTQPGYYSTNGDEPSVPAPPGYYVSTNGAVVPSPAPPGSYITNFAATFPIPADPGYYCPLTAMTSELPAQAGYYVSTNGATNEIPAPPGYYVTNVAATNAIAASAGYYCPMVGMTAEFPALAGSYVASDASTFTVLADPGYYVPTNTATNEIPATVGYYCPLFGMAVPILAAPGYYVSNTAASNQIPAAPGYYVPMSGATNQTAADPGYYCPTPAMTNEIQATPGFYVSNSAATNLIAASPGYYVSNAAGTNQMPAPLGHYVPGAGAITSYPAPPGFFVSNTAATFPTPATGGFYVSNTGASNETPALLGYYVAADASTFSLPASPGYYVSNTAASSQTPASPGYFVSNSAAILPTASPPGYYCPAQAMTNPIAASPGYFINFSGATNQTPASPGHYVPSPAATNQLLANIGSYCPTFGMSNNLLASPGYFVSYSGATNMTAASPGYFVSSFGAYVASQAPPGYYCPIAGMSAAIPASPGYYVPGPGATNQIPAPPGYYTSGPAATNLTPAPDGSLAPIAGMSGTILASDLTSSESGTGALQVTLSPTNAISAGALWQIDGGQAQTSGTTLSNILVGTHTISFLPASGWNPPIDQIVTISNGLTTAITNTYTSSSATGTLVLVTNGAGTINQKSLPSHLVAGKSYTVSAVAGTGYVFDNWIGGPVEPYSVLSTNAKYTFQMQSNLLLEAHFVPNLFLTAQGNYTGLFAPAGNTREQTNSGAFRLTITKTGDVSGQLYLASEKLPVTGKFNSYGSATLFSVPHGGAPLTTTLQLDLASQAVEGTVSDGSFIALAVGYQNASDSHHATSLAGAYTFVIPGASNSALGPIGTGFGTVNVNSAGTITVSGSLADGTPFTQSSELSSNGYWPLYVNLYNGQGSLWGWNYFTSNTVASAPTLSWINATNSSKTAVNHTGFTNQQATLIGSIYNSQVTLPNEGDVILTGNNLVETNGVVLKSGNKIEATNNSGLLMTVNKATGIISGSFKNPTNSIQLIKVSGVILKNENEAEGYFLYNGESGNFEIIPPQ